LKDVYKANPGLDFIPEPNGLLLGHGLGFVRRLSQFKCLEVRISFKAFDEEVFKDLIN